MLLFPEDCVSSGLSQDPPNKKNNLLNMEIFSWGVPFNFKIKIRLLESDQKWLRHGSSTKPLLSRCKGDNTSKKIIF